MVRNQIITSKNIQRKVAGHERIEIKEVSTEQPTAGEVKFVAITTKTETEPSKSYDTEDEEHESERKQKVMGRESIDKGKILGRKWESFDVEEWKLESRMEKKEGGLEKEKKNFNY